MLVGMLGWAIWNCRNEIVWRQKSIEALGVVELAKRPLINGDVLRIEILITISGI